MTTSKKLQLLKLLLSSDENLKILLSNENTDKINSIKQNFKNCIHSDVSDQQLKLIKLKRKHNNKPFRINVIPPNKHGISENQVREQNKVFNTGSFLGFKNDLTIHDILNANIPDTDKKEFIKIHFPELLALRDSN